MNTIGEKVRVRDKTPADYTMEAFWGLDKEITALNPPAGKAFNHESFSIETLDGKHIGSCSLYNITSVEAQLGIRIGDKEYWGKGYGEDAINILIDYCFSTKSIERIWLKVLPQNIRAIRCYEKCGFAQHGKLALDGHCFIVMERRRTNGNATPH